MATAAAESETSAAELGIMKDGQHDDLSRTEGAHGKSTADAAGGSATASPTSPSSGGGHDEEKEDDRVAFECNICLDAAKDAVISVCGHLFCWPCLHQWLETRPNHQICPVCKAGISREKVIPLYGRGNTDNKDPRDKVPPRPRGQRSEPEDTGGGTSFFTPFGSFGGPHNGGGFQMSFGIGAFPFGFFATNLNMGDSRRIQGVNPQMEDEQFVSRVFLYVAMAFIFWLMLA